MTTFPLHLEILDDSRRTLFSLIAPYTRGFYLSGGTALALQLGHRISFDFDFFSNLPITDNLAQKLSQIVQIKNVAIDTSDELTFFTTSEVKLTFLHYPFTLSCTLIELENTIQMAPIDEIAIQKAYTIGRRGAYRDYFDLYTILQKELLTLEKIIEGAEKKYKELFNSKLFLEQLVFFDDILNFEIITPPQIPITPTHVVKTFLEEKVRSCLAG